MEKGRIFKGLNSGKFYDKMTPFFGMNNKFFIKSTDNIQIESGMKIMDLGCGTGKLLFKIAEKAPNDCVLYGVDYSPEQLTYAEKLKTNYPQEIILMHGSMDDIQFSDEYFDIITVSMALHAVNPLIRENAIANAVRMLKKNGLFVIIDIGNARKGIISAIYWVLGSTNRKDKYNPNAITVCCKEKGLELQSEEYINSLIIRQIYKKV